MITAQALFITFAAIMMAFIRRIDGIDRDHLSKLKRNAIGFLVRALPLFIFSALACNSFGYEWKVALSGAALGACVSGNLQMEYDGWEDFDIHQIARFWLAILAYAAMCYYSPVLSVAGAVCCILAGLTRPVLNRLSVPRYTVYSEYTEGALMAAPFFVVLIKETTL